MQQKMLIGAGIIVLFFVHVIGAVALGIYVGRYGMTRDGLTFQRPNVQQDNLHPPPVGAPMQRPPGQAPQNQPGNGEPNIVGRIRHIGPNSLDLATREGPHQVALTGNTLLMGKDRQQISPEMLVEGDIVAVYGFFDDTGRQLIAKTVILVPMAEVKPN